jgi:hypothetical protein
VREGTAQIRLCPVGWAVSVKHDTYRPTYPIFTKIIKNRILRGYVSKAYRIRDTLVNWRIRVTELEINYHIPNHS